MYYFDIWIRRNVACTADLLFNEILIMVLYYKAVSYRINKLINLYNLLNVHVLAVFKLIVQSPFLDYFMGVCKFF